MLDWSRQYSIFLFLDNNSYITQFHGYECLLAVGAIETTSGMEDDKLQLLSQLHLRHCDWVFGHINYDYKNFLEPKLSSRWGRESSFDETNFFIPEIVLHINREQDLFTIESIGNPYLIHREIMLQTALPVISLPKVDFRHALDKSGYLDNISKIKNHILNGDCYELNYCTKGYADDVDIAPLDVYKALNTISPAPYSAFYRLNENYLMCASPERYLSKSGNKLVAQPIKGTSARSLDPIEDENSKANLYSNIKERAENVMIVDLMRNDLARCCVTGSINVDELFGIYSFPQVHQMISTVVGELKPDLHFTDAIRYTFPMGSMTGAPKFKVMELIDEYETQRRGLFSGTVGYITPNGDFDFNVVIRSLFYNSDSKQLSYQTGGAITWDSDPEQEWEEMRLKAWALERIFDGKH